MEPGIGDSCLPQRAAKGYTAHNKSIVLIEDREPKEVWTGSSNFSNASTKNNDENMLVVCGDARVADVYLGEFMRLFNHFFVRKLARQRDPDAARGAYRAPNDS